MKRIEITFTSGKFIAFPDVHEYKKVVDNGLDVLKIRHGSRDDIAYVMVSKIDFMEVMIIKE